MNTAQAYWELERHVVRLIGIPTFLGSNRKADRKHGQHVLDDIVLPRLTSIDCAVSEIDWELHPGSTLPEYLRLLKGGAYGSAAEYARRWVMDLREERRVAEDFDKTG